jgi:hypothetical protein
VSELTIWAAAKWPVEIAEATDGAWARRSPAA